jgi:penicillin-binding protein A
MNKQLKRVSAVMLLMFVALFASTSIIQVIDGDDLKANAHNSRTLYASFSAQRGSILVDGNEIVESKAVDDDYKYLRQYKDGKLYAPVTGYFTLNQGTTGIEGALNSELSGTANEQFLDQVGSIFTGQDPKGASVSLTLDAAVQKAAYKALGNNTGAVVAINPKTGAILAMVSKTSYDPNLLAGHNTKDVIKNYTTLNTSAKKPLVNRAIAGDLYHPGSTFKLVVASAALESGQYTLDSEFANPSTLTLPQSTSVINNSEGGTCGGTKKATIATALRLSCNIPMAELGAALGEQTIADEAAKFGFGKSISIPMKVTPSVYPTGMDEASLMLSSFGQYNDKVTPLQMAMVSSAIANGGVLMQPYLVDKVIRPDLSVLSKTDPSVFSTPLKPENASAMTDAMIQDVANGAASNARITGVDVAGKTGTAENGTTDPYTLWFTGFAPAKDPEVAVAVVVENGGGLGQSSIGNVVAAPIAKKVIEAVLNK